MGGLIGGASAGAQSNTVSNTDNRLSAMQFQTSTLGTTLNVVYGCARVTPNLIYYTDFNAIAHTSSQTTSSGGGGGGKGGGGGGGGGSTTTYTTTCTYQAALMLALCEGPIAGIATVWRSKDLFSNPSDIGFQLKDGSVGQSAQSYMVSNHPSEALGYSGIAYLFGSQVDLTSSAGMYNYSFEIYGKNIAGVGTMQDANPKDIVYDIMTNSRYGAGLSTSDFGDLSPFESYCYAKGLLISPNYDTQQSASAVLDELCVITNSSAILSDGVIKLIPQDDASYSQYGYSFTPSTSPVYDLNSEDFIVSTTGEDPIKITRNTTADAFNQVQIEFMNRANSYNIEIATAKDQASIEANGLRPQSIVQLHSVTTPTVAMLVAQSILQRYLYIRNTYEFTLGWRYARLEPMDIVSLTDDLLGLDRFAVRITEVNEDEAGNLAIVAEEYNFGVASASLYPHQNNAGWAHNYQIAPGDVTTPFFFEPPVELTIHGLGVWAALTGNNINWGGCSIWTSLDGSSYKRVNRIFGGARYGQLTSDLTSANSLAVNLVGNGGQLFSGTTEDAAQLQTLCVVNNGAHTEYLAYKTATLTSANHYTLTDLVRGAYESTHLDKATGSKFARVDAAIAKSEELDLDMVGKTIYFKFTSFNVYGGAEQSIADVPSYSYAVTGEMLQLPPSDVTGLAIYSSNNGSLVTWDSDPQPDWDYTEIRLGSSWDDGVFIAKAKTTTQLLGWLPAGTNTVWAKHVDIFGNYSVNPVSASILIYAPAAVTINRSEVQENSVALGWGDSKVTQPIQTYKIYMGSAGTAFSSATFYGSAGADSRSDIVIFRSAGAKVIWIVAVDVAGNVGTPSSVNVTVQLPTNFVLANEYDETWGLGTITHGYVDAGSLYLPVNSQSWSDHFSTRSYTDIADQIAAGFPLYFEPSESSGSYFEHHDIGKIMPNGKISVVPLSVVMAGSLSDSVLIEWSVDDSTWISATAGATEVQASDFRYVRVTYTVTASGGDDLIRLDRLHVSIASQTVNEFTALTLNASDVIGTPYACTQPFLDVVSATATPLSSPAIALLNVIIDDSGPTAYIYVQAWNASNVRCGGTVSLNIGGY